MSSMWEIHEQKNIKGKYLHESGFDNLVIGKNGDGSFGYYIHKDNSPDGALGTLEDALSRGFEKGCIYIGIRDGDEKIHSILNYHVHVTEDFDRLVNEFNELVLTPEALAQIREEVTA